MSETNEAIDDDQLDIAGGTMGTQEGYAQRIAYLQEEISKMTSELNALIQMHQTRR